MKSVISMVLGVVIAGGAAGSAAAFKFAPPSAVFSATGSIAITAPSGGAYECKVTIRGKTSKTGRAKIMHAIFMPGASSCANTAAAGLPWHVKAASATAGVITNAAIITPFGNCGAGPLPIMVSGGGVWSFNAPLPPSCANVSGSLMTAPPIVIVP